MGLNTQGGGTSNKTHLSIFSGDIVLQYNEREDLEKKLDNLGLDKGKILVRKKQKGKNEGQDVHYFVIRDGVTGYISNVEIRKMDWGEIVIVTLTDVDQVFEITLGAPEERIVNDFSKRCENIDLSKEITFQVWSFETNEKTGQKANSGVTIYYDVEAKSKAELKYSSSNLNGMPSAKQKRNKDWDYTEQNEFLHYDILEKFIEKNFKNQDGKPTKKKEKTDDLPF